MSNYYMYRINPSYDGFFPSTIPERTNRGIMKFNWGAYLENLEYGDVVLVYFTGRGCSTGIYGVAVIRDADITSYEENVTARLLTYNCDNHAPLIPVRGNKKLYEQIRSRPRGAEVVVPDVYASTVYAALATHEELVAEADKWNVDLPGAPQLRALNLKQIPLVNLGNDLSLIVQNRGLIPAFWIRPKQASWISNCPPWLSQISSIFGSFKSGDVSRLNYLTDKMVKQVQRTIPRARNKFAAIISVPLNEKKHSNGEIDRVGELAKFISKKTGLPYFEAFRLKGNISRRLYKRWGLGSNYFRKKYLEQLKIRDQRRLGCLLRDGKSILLIDDVYTDGLTTATIVDALKQKFPKETINVTIATLGIMAKQNNMNRDLIESWR